MVDAFVSIGALFAGAAIGQFSIAMGWIALVVALFCGYRKAGWFSIQVIAAAGALVASFVFRGTEVDVKWGGLAGRVGFNLIVYFVIAIAGYLAGWLVTRVLRKGADD